MINMSIKTRKHFIKHNLSDEHLTRARKEYENEVEDETKECVYHAEEDDYILKPKTITKDNTKVITKTKPSTKAKTTAEHNIFTRTKFECKKCHEAFRKKALNTHLYSHNGLHLENTKHFDINSGHIMKEFYITDKAGNYIEDIDVAFNN